MGSGSVTLKQKKRVKHAKNKYLKPGALAQIRYSRSTSRDIGKKRILLNVKDELEMSPQAEVPLENTIPILSPARLNFEPFGSNKGQILPKTPRTPDTSDFGGDSRLESLPLDLLIKIMCCLHHDQLKAVFHVSKRMRKAVELARQYHFNYTTPDRSRQELLLNKTPLPTEHWPFLRIDGKDVRISTPRTPRAPKHAARLSRLKLVDVKPITTVLCRSQLFFFRSLLLLSLQSVSDAQCHQDCQGLYPKLRPHLEFYDMRRSFAKQWHRISFSEDPTSVLLSLIVYSLSVSSPLV